MMPTADRMFLLMLAVGGLSALAVFLSFYAFSVYRLRPSSPVREMRSENVSDEPSKLSRVRSMDERRKSIEEMLTRLENEQPA